MASRSCVSEKFLPIRPIWLDHPEREDRACVREISWSCSSVGESLIKRIGMPRHSGLRRIQLAKASPLMEGMLQSIRARSGAW